ncbi:hypothetical protein M5K25_001521 [Dendrobium thyrsiflorum]|uniref:Glabrous enhancer-binding protein-like DBD domain-containing protein n=1 Tax=Dendrobium thyrsiflorum TaxID=117978 RepID=A0ABD0VYB3_DENTH
MAKKSKEKLPPPPTPPSASPTSSSSSSDEEDSPPPAISPVKKPAAGSTTAVLQKHPEPSPKFFSGEKEEDEENSENEEESTDEESSEDSGAAAVKANPLPLPTDSRNADGKQGFNTSPPSDTESEDGEEVDSSSESEQQPLPPPPQEAANAEGKQAATPIPGSDSASEDESESSSDSDAVAPSFRVSSRNTADPSLKPLSSKPMGSPVQPADKSPISRKRSTTTPAQISEKKRKTADIVGAEAVQEKKEFTRKIWSKADELALLQCILDYNEHHHGTSTQVPVESLLKSVNDSLSSSITLSQMNHKIRRLKQKYNATVKKVKDVNNPNISNANDAAAFDLSRKIWGPRKDEPVFPENNLKPQKAKKVKEIIKEDKGKANHLAVEYPFLRWHAKNDHADIASVVQSHIPTAEAEHLEGSCKKLEITEIQLHMKKMKLLSSSLKLIEDALAKL